MVLFLLGDFWFPLSLDEYVFICTCWLHICPYACGLCACCVCMVVVMVVVMLSWRSWWSCCQNVFIMNACQYLYVFLIHVYCEYVCYAFHLVGVIIVELCMVTRITIKMMSIYCYEYDYKCIVLIWLILQMRYPHLSYTEVCWLCLSFGLADMI